MKKWIVIFFIFLSSTAWGQDVWEERMNFSSKIVENLGLQLVGREYSENLTAEVWENIKYEFVLVYAEIFSTDELKQLMVFFESPAGRKYTEKLPEILAKSNSIVNEYKPPPVDKKAKQILRTLSTAAETYGTVNSGNYPTSIDLLLNANPAYLRENYCDSTISGYRISCEMSATGYAFTAIPEDGSGEKKTVRISTGGVMTP